MNEKLAQNRADMNPNHSRGAAANGGKLKFTRNGLQMEVCKMKSLSNILQITPDPR